MEFEPIHPLSRSKWREWLEKNHGEKKEIWVISYKKLSKKPSISYEELVEEAVCFGWIDSRVRRVDEEKFATRFTPRQSNTKWSRSNLSRALKMLREGKMTPAGLKLLPPELTRRKNS